MRHDTIDPDMSGRFGRSGPDEGPDQGAETQATLASRARGRGATTNPGNRFDGVRLHVLGEELDRQIDEHPDGVQVRTEVVSDATRQIINFVDPRVSPDIGFRWTINPYRGCEHGCTYCYARPTHEFLGLSCGLDFETKLVAKTNAAALLRRELAAPSWKADTVVMSGVTDPYQPVERRLRITRACLEVFAEARHPVSLITKNHMITRDLDLLAQLAALGACRAAISITTLDAALARSMEPRASSPTDRLRAVRALADAGVPVAVMIAPVIPGLNDKEIPALLEAARAAGATSAGWILLRLPEQLKEVFTSWLQSHAPERAGHVESLLRQTRGGAIYDARHGVRQRGTGEIAARIGDLFNLFVRRHRLGAPWEPLNREHFRRPQTGGQLSLSFD